MHFVGKINYSACSKFLFCEGNLSFYHIRDQYATQERQGTYKHNNAAHSYNQCCSRKASITQPECVYL